MAGPSYAHSKRSKNALWRRVAPSGTHRYGLPGVAGQEGLGEGLGLGVLPAVQGVLQVPGFQVCSSCWGSQLFRVCLGH